MELETREVREDDWRRVLDLANRSVAHVDGAPTQDAWLANRRAFAAKSMVPRQWCALATDTHQLVGFLAVERGPDSPAARLFVVTDPADRDNVGLQLLYRGLAIARDDGATSAYLIEYASDAPFLSWLRDHGFTESRRISLPEGGEACVMAVSLSD